MASLKTLPALGSLIPSLYSNPAFLTLETCLFVIFPLWLITSIPALLHYRHFMLLAGIGYYLAVMKILAISGKQLGFNLNGLIPAIGAIAPFTILAMAGILLIGLVSPDLLYLETVGREIGNTPVIYPILAYFFVSVPIQEIMLRALLIARLEFVSRNRTFLVIASAAIFSFLHLPFSNLLFTLATCVLGLIWSDNFVRYKNIFAVMLSHSLVGALLIYFISTQ